MALTKIKGAGVNISATEKLYFDDGGNTYIYESAADVLDVYVGGANMVKLTESTTDTVTVTGDLTVGVDGTGHDVKFFGDTGSAYMLWDQSADDLILSGTAQLSIDTATDASSTTTGSFHTDGGVGIAKKLYVGTDLDVDGTTNLDAVDIDGAVQIDNTITVGADDQGYDVIFYGDTASSNMTWDTSADDLILNDATLKIDQDDNAKSIEIDTEATSQYAIVVDTPANTTAAVLAVVACDSLTSGGIAKFTSNSPDNSQSRNLVEIVNDNAAADNAVGLYIQQDGADASIELAGNGSIKFPGTQGASSDANSLDDYEEGDWTPTITGADSGSMGLIGASNRMYYTKIGRVVHLQGYVSINSDSSLTGNIMVSLPIACADLTDDGEYAMGTLACTNTGSTNDFHPYVFAYAGANATLWSVSDSGGAHYLDEGDVDNNWQFGFTLTYISV